MHKNDLLKNGETIIRLLDIKDNQALIIDCKRRTMPHWMGFSRLTGWEICSNAELYALTNMIPNIVFPSDGDLHRIARQRFTMIAGILPFIGDDKMRNHLISLVADENNVCKQTVRNYLCLYLAYQNFSVLAPKRNKEDKPLTKDEKNMRWALNKFFYTQNQNSLNTAYTMMLREKYTDSTGALIDSFPTFNQFRYFYSKHRNLQHYYISRHGLKNYQRNNRPLTGDGVQAFAPSIGVGMLDSTICDIYLVDDSGNLIGRPILTACIDAYSGLCCGYALSWEGGVYILRSLLLNVISDKVMLCNQFGFSISPEVWNCKHLPATLVTDKGAEYASSNFEQIAELGIKVINLPAYRPELKGAVEKFFDLVQGLYKPYLKGKGVIEPDFQERGAHDYRKDACLTLKTFETIFLHCVIYYNSQRIIENFPYTADMISANVAPTSSAIWNWGMTQPGANLISVAKEQLLLTLLPRTTGTFSRHGLKVNKLRYVHKDYTEAFLTGGTATVAYNPDSVSYVWLIEKGSYIRFELIESRFSDKDLGSVQSIRTSQKSIVKEAATQNLQAKVELANHILAISSSSASSGTTEIKSIRERRRRAQNKAHIDHMKGVSSDGR